MLKSLASMRRAATVPNLVVVQRVLNKMAAAARHFIADETGEALVGLVVPGEYTNGIPTIYVLDTISPDDSAVRQLHTFQQGDDRQDEIIWWLQENWRVYRQHEQGKSSQVSQSKWDVPLRYLGDWHKQPGFMIQPSVGDQMTALSWLDDDENGMDYLLAPIVTVGHPSTTINSPALANFVALPFDDLSHMRVDFWYIHRDVRMFQPIIPAVYPDDQLPALPDYPWHLVKPERAGAEFARLHDEGLFTSVVLWNADEPPPLEICFMSARMGADRVLLISTAWNYPEQPPAARVAPFLNLEADDDLYDVFEEMWAQSEAVADPPGWQWSPEKYLVDYIRVLEDSLGIRPPVVEITVTPTPEATSVPVTTEVGTPADEAAEVEEEKVPEDES